MQHARGSILHYFPLQHTHPEVVKVARNALGHPTTVHANGPFTCFGCNGTLVFRRSHKRTRNGTHKTTTFHVQDHFVHAVATAQCHGETYLHAAAKALLMQRPSYPLWFHCSRCDTEKPLCLVPGPATLRGVLEYATALHGRRVDVALLSDDDALTGVIEIRKTHACDDDKLQDLQDLVGDRWCELYAHDVVECMAADRPIPVATCSARLCDTCTSLRSHTRTCAWDIVLDFGKYSGASLESVMDVDPKYVQWLATGGEGTTMSFAIPGAVVKRARSLTKGLCADDGASKCQKCQHGSATVHEAP